MFFPIQLIIPRAINKLGIKTEVEAALICERYRKFAPSIVHKDALQNTFPKFYRRRTLTIGVSNPAWAHQVHINKGKIIAAINESIGRKQVEFLVTNVAEQTSLT